MSDAIEQSQKMPRFVHITDTHIGPTPDFVLYGRKPFECARRLIDAILELPFDYDFILHTGDVADDGSEASYELARELFARLRKPVYCVIGNHDGLPHFATMLGSGRGEFADVDARVDYSVTLGDAELIVLDTRGPVDPGGTLLNHQLRSLETMLNATGPDVIVAMHHQPITLDTPWLDHGGSDWPAGKFMRVSNGEELVAILSRSKRRIAGVFFGHVHGGFQVVRDGIGYFACPSAVVQFDNHPEAIKPRANDTSFPALEVVTITAAHTIVRPVILDRPA